MNKTSSCIYLLSRFLMFNPEETRKFESFDQIHSTMLYSSLALNYKEIFEKAAPFTNYYFCFDDKDKEFIPQEFNYEKIIWGDTNELNKFLIYLNEKYFSNYSNNIIILTDSIGPAIKDLKKVFNLLSIEDDAVIIGKAFGSKACCIGFNSLTQDIFRQMNFLNLDFDSVLNAVCRHNAHINVIDSFILVENISDFKKLYSELSKKESLAYCSQRIHERFTHLFIEYKDLLK